MKRPVGPLLLLFALAGGAFAQANDTGVPQITVSHNAAGWTIKGQKNTVTLDDKTLAITIHAGSTDWHTVASSAKDMQVRAGNGGEWLRLASASSKEMVAYKTGYSTGVKITLAGFRSAKSAAPLDTKLFLTVALEGGDEDLIFETAAVEGNARIRELNWPSAMDGSQVDATLLSNDSGELLPRDWPTPYYPIHRSKTDDSVIQSHLIESWSMSWWGFQKGSAAMMVIVETPDDAAYTFSHPAGGPTSMGPSWKPQLRHFGYVRRLRMCFIPKGNYVDLAKRYRKYAMETGLFVSLKEKIARDPQVASLIGAPVAGARILRDVNPESPRYDKAHPEQNRQLTTFAEQIDRLRALKAAGIEKLNVNVSGWPNLGYDRQHPDGLPPNEAGGGWQGMKALFDACKELGYTCWLHDQYRDYYPDAPTFNKEFAVHDESASEPLQRFPGTRFHPHDYRDGDIPMMNYWDGGPQAYMNNLYMLGHVEKNYRTIFEHGIHPNGSYMDVFGYIPPDEDFNPEHPCTRTESMNARAGVCNWVRSNLGICGVEAGSDWLIPYVDYVSSRTNRNANSGNDATSKDAVPVPLYELVYHDAVVTTESPDNPRAFLHAAAPSMNTASKDFTQIKRLAALHKRVGMLEMTNHEFLDAARTLERTTFADGTMVTVDWPSKKVTIDPDVDVSGGAPAGRAAWMREGFGVMTHYLADWRQRTDSVPMSVENWSDLVDHFDVNGLAEQIASVGAKYLILTIGQNSGYYDTPCPAYDRFVGNQPSKCSRRDLIADMSDALAKHGIKLIAYLPSGAPGQDAKAKAALGWQNGIHRNREFQEKWQEVVRDWSLRWGTKVSGWWFDGAYWPNTMYRSPEPPNFESFAAAARAGNPASAVAFNPGVVPRLISVTPHEDYSAGEENDPPRITILRTENGLLDGVQPHVLSFLGARWGMGEPRFTTEEAVKFSQDLRSKGAAVTWDVPIQKNGLISQPFIDQLTAIGKAIGRR